MFLKNLIHGIFPFLGFLRYGDLGKRLVLVGITGTDGKSSSVILLAAMLRAGGHKVAHFSSVSFHNGDEEFPNDMKMTTPGYMQLHRFLADAVRRGCTHAVLEITSQGILQHRHRGLSFSLAGITNITPEHIEAHGGFEKYRDAKLSLLAALKRDSLGLLISEDTYAEMKTLLPLGIPIHIARHESLEDGVGDAPPGPFASMNTAFAAHAAMLLGVSPSAVTKGAQAVGVIPGRFEIVSTVPLVIVDYAHTLNALGIVLPYVRKNTKGKLIHVFGAAGGGRDSYKRPLLAKLSEEYADISILTEENSFDEPVGDIISDIKKGFSETHPVEVFTQREEAVRRGLSLSGPDDTLLLTAKGSESVIAGPEGTKRPYTERTYIRCLLETSSSAPRQI